MKLYEVWFFVPPTLDVRYWEQRTLWVVADTALTVITYVLRMHPGARISNFSEKIGQVAIVS